jgi:hypothetical protein
MEQGAVGAVRRWSVSSGISVTKFVSPPIAEAILRASSVRVQVSILREYAAATEIGKKSEGLGYRTNRAIA